MKIGIDISQIIYNGGVGEYLTHLIQEMVKIDTKNKYILFGSSLRGRDRFKQFQQSLTCYQNVSFKFISIPPFVLDIMWNRLHMFPIESFIGEIDIFITSDWTEPPTSTAKKVTILYDVIVYKFPEETDAKIIATQKRKLKWVKKEVSTILCISESTKKDAIEVLGIPENNLKVIYPGTTL